MIKSGMALAVLALAVLMPTGGAGAEVVNATESGFIVKHSVDVASNKAEVWKVLVAPAKWWSGEHTWSGDAANLYFDSQATGCFCEKLPKPAEAPADQRMGSVEHMHIVYSDPQRGLLRMKGGLGPLQGEPVNGVWTITLKPIESGGTRIEWDYAVNGLMRMKGGDIAPAVDGVMGQQLARLAALFAPAN